jgi:16S rRNA (guanine527-N7)-methyltransferase
MSPLTATEFADLIPVSRETLARLHAYVDCLGKWTRRINLVAPSSMDDVWRRHILDSAQLYRLLPPDRGGLVDLGSGAGLPGLVLAIMGVTDMHLIESDQRKAVFLQEAARVTGTTVTIHSRRIEAMPSLSANIVTARALARLNLLLDYAAPFLTPDSTCYFLKGAGLADELTEARKSWHMNVSEIPSLSGASGVIVKLESIRER